MVPRHMRDGSRNNMKGLCTFHKLGLNAIPRTHKLMANRPPKRPQEEAWFFADNTPE